MYIINTCIYKLWFKARLTWDVIVFTWKYHRKYMEFISCHEIIGNPGYDMKHDMMWYRMGQDRAGPDRRWSSWCSDPQNKAADRKKGYQRSRAYIKLARTNICASNLPATSNNYESWSYNKPQHILYQWGGQGYQWGGLGYQWGELGYQWRELGYLGRAGISVGRAGISVGEMGYQWGGLGYQWGGLGYQWRGLGYQERAGVSVGRAGIFLMGGWFFPTTLSHLPTNIKGCTLSLRNRLPWGGRCHADKTLACSCNLLLLHI